MSTFYIEIMGFVDLGDNVDNFIAPNQWLDINYFLW